MAAGLVAAALPSDARAFYLNHISSLDWLIIGFGVLLFLSQLLLMHRALTVRNGSFEAGADRWISNLAQAAEWFPLLGLLGTVAGILQTFSAINGPTPPERIIMLYA